MALRLISQWRLRCSRRLQNGYRILRDAADSLKYVECVDEKHTISAYYQEKLRSCAHIGTIKMKLKNSSKVFAISKSSPSTQICPACGTLNKHPLDKRDYDCLHCGYHHNSRDKKSAQSILDEELRRVSMDHRTKSPVEAESTIKDLIVDGKLPPMTQETKVF